MVCAFETSKPTFQGHISSNQATPPENSVTIWDQTFKYLSPWGLFSFKQPNVVIF